MEDQDHGKVAPKTRDCVSSKPEWLTSLEEIKEGSDVRHRKLVAREAGGEGGLSEDHPKTE